MAKRLTDSSKWNDNWFTNLPMDMKLVWIYLLDTCDHAGVYKSNIRLLKFQTGTERSEDEIKMFLKERIYVSGDKWFIPKFCTLQYKNFFTNNAPAVKSARELLINHNIINENDNSFKTVNEELSNPYVTLIEVLDNPLQRTKDKDTDTDTDINMNIDKDNDMNIEKNNKTKNIAKSIIEKLSDYNLDIKLYDDAVGDWNDLGGIEEIANIMNWDTETKLKYKEQLDRVYNVKHQNSY